MKTGLAGINLIKGFESCELLSYPDPASELFKQCLRLKISPYNKGYIKLSDWESFKSSPWTIGFGHTRNVTSNMQITQEQAEEFLKEDLAVFEAGVTRLIKVTLTQNQFDALVSFAFNVGLGALERSSLRMKLNRKDYTGASKEFLKWNKCGGLVSNGLTRRRLAEKKLFDLI